MAWGVWETESGVHVVPEQDEIEHEHNITCWCHPTLDDTIWVHHSRDRREETEENLQ